MKTTNATNPKPAKTQSTLGFNRIELNLILIALTNLQLSGSIAENSSMVPEVIRLKAKLEKAKGKLG